MTLDQLIARLQALSAAGHGKEEVHVGYGGGDEEERFLIVTKADHLTNVYPKGIWLFEAASAEDDGR